MRRALKWIFRAVVVIVLLPVVLIAVLLIALNTAPGQHEAESILAGVLGSDIKVSGISGRIPAAPRVAHFEMRDARGVWLSIDDIALDWSPLRLLGGTAKIDRLTVGHVAVDRPPESAAPATPSSGGGFTLPVTVDVESAHVDRVDLGAPVAGAPASVAIDLKGRMVSLTDGDADATLHQIGGPGIYTLTGQIDDRHITAHLDASESAHGLASNLTGLPDLGAFFVHASVDGPWTAAATDVSLTAGKLRATAKGNINITGEAADLDVSATAPAMTPRPDLSWQAVALDAHVHGPFTKPEAAGHLRVDGFSGAGAGLRQLTADVQGNAGAVSLHAALEGLRIPGPKPDLFEASPVTLDADARLDSPDRPVTFTLTHPLVTARGTAHTGGDISVNVALAVPDVSPFAAIGGVDLRGSTDLTVAARMSNGTTNATVDGSVAITGGMSPVPGLIGPAGKLGVTAALRGNDITLSRLQVDGKTVSLAATGGMTGGVVDLNWKLALADLALLAPSVSGTLDGTGHVAGRADALAATADIAGDVATAGYPRAPVKISVNANGLPGAPSGTITATGALEGSPVNLAVDANRAADGTLAVIINRANWKDTNASGAVSLAPGATLPTGKITVHAGRLGDFSRLAGQPLDGSVDIVAELANDIATLDLRARNAGVPGTGATSANLTVRVTNPTTRPDVRAELAIDGLRAAGSAGSVRLSLAGPESALGLRLTAKLENFNGSALQADTAGTLNVQKMDLAIASLATTWKSETLRLLAPTRVSLANGLSVEKTRIGLRQAELDIGGKISPTLDLTASLRNVSADLATILAPDLKAQGTLSADAHITGTPVRPAGTIHLAASGLKLASGPAAGMPAASITADATLAGTSARIDTKLSAGRNTISVTGIAPLDPSGVLGLRATGAIDLATLNPILTANGERVVGHVALDAAVSGTIAAPRANGSLSLTGGEVQDFAQNVRITGMRALIEANGDTVRISRFSGQAGKGTISASGTLGLAAPMPVDLAITARNATPLAGDQLTATLNSDITVRGALRGTLNIAGTVGVENANIQVPENLPTQVAVLDVRRPGQKPRPAPGPTPVAPAPESGPRIGLGIKVHAPGQIFVRGRGLDAELQGDLTIAGTTAAPLISGGFQLRRGTFSLAGQSLTFTSGEVSFDGSGRIDPTLNFIATSSNASVTATLAVTGYASAPKITLSSVPTLPQDEVLAQLLFHQSAASLSPFQLAEIAVALAQITGVGGAGGFDPLNSVRGALGLDRLSVGGGSSGSSATVQAGRYVAKGVYVGASQATSGGGTQATVQIDLMKGLKLETDVGTGGSSTGASSSTTSNGTSVGLTYQFEY
jgi:translocation and assembly module TamB